MKSFRFLAPRTLPLLTALLLLAGLAPAHAQYTDNFQTNTITVFTSWPSNYFVGSNTWGDVLLIQGGGMLTSMTGYVGYASSSSNNVATVSDSGSVWSNANILAIGTSGSGNRLLIANGGAVFNTDGIVGYNASSSNNVVTVAGSGSVWSNSANLSIGNAGWGNRLLIANGGTAFNNYGYVGYNASSSNNVVTVAGSGSVWSNRSGLYVGSDGSGNQLLITNGGAVFNGYGYVGNSPSSSNNTVTVAGAGSVWNNRDDLYIGRFGCGNQLLITNGGVVSDSTVYLGDMLPGSNNVATVVGSGSVWSNRNGFYVGTRGSGNGVLIADGGMLVVSNTAYVGYSSFSSNNTVTVVGPGSIWINKTQMILSYNSSFGSAVTISNGAALVSVGGYMYGSNSTVLIGDGGSVWTNTGIFTINGTNNALTVLSGGRVDGAKGGITLNSYLGQVFLGGTNTYTGNTTLNQGTLVVSNELALQNSTLVIANGLVPVFGSGITGFTLGGLAGSADMGLTNAAGAAIALTVGNNSSNTTYGGVISGPGSLIKVGAGTFSVTNNNSIACALIVSNGTLQIGAGGPSGWIVGDITNFGSLAFNRSDAVTFSNVISGSGALVKNGIGTVVLTAANPYTGGTFLSNGTLSIAADAHVGGASSAITFGGGTLQVTGTAISNLDTHAVNWGTFNGGLDVADAGNTFTVTNALAGSFKKAGAGALVLSSVSLTNFAFSSGNAGTLQVNGGLVGLNGTLYLGNLATDVASLVVSGAVVTNGVLYVGYSGSGNQLLITNGGAVFNGSGYVGNQSSSSNNAVKVAGPGSVWTNSSTLAVGYSGSGNQLLITNGGAALSSSGYVGYFSSSSNNMATVAGSGSVWVNGGQMRLGNAGSGNQLRVADGGLLVDAYGDIGGGASSSNNTLTVTGRGSLWSNTLNITTYGWNSQLVIADGGAVVNSNGYVGYQSSASNNVVLVTDPGSVWKNNASLVLGPGSGGRVTISNGAALVSAGGSMSGSSNAIVIAGGGSVWTNTGIFTITGTNNTLTILNGGSMAGAGGGITLNSLGGQLVLAGAGSYSGNTTNTLGTIVLGADHVLGTGTLVMNGGAIQAADAGVRQLSNALVFTANALFGAAGTGDLLFDAPVVDLGGATRTLTVSNGVTTFSGITTNAGLTKAGPGTLVLSSAWLTNLAFSGNAGTLQVNGGRLSTTNLILGNAAADVATLVVSGAGTVLTNRGDLVVGNVGSGNQLLITNGGTVFNNFGYVGYLSSSSSNNVVAVAGSGSVWNNASNLYVGAYGSGNRLLITNGGTVFNNAGYVGSQSSSSNNAVTVSGSGSVWSNRMALSVGSSGSGNQLLIANGGTVFSGNGNLGWNSSSSNNTVTVSAGGSVWSNRTDLYVGGSGSGNRLLIANGGTVFNRNGYVGYQSSSSNNVVTVTGSGSLWSNSGNLSVGTSGWSNRVLVTNGGTVTAVGTLSLGSLGVTGSVVQVSGGGMISASNLVLTRGSYVSQGGTNTFGYGMIIGAAGAFTADASSLLTVSGTVQNAGTVILGSRYTVAAANPWQSLGGATNQFDGGLAILAGGVFQATNGASVVGGAVTNSGTILFSRGSSISFLGPALTLNGTIGFARTNTAPVDGLAGMGYSGNNTLWMDASTNAMVASYLLDSAANTGNATNYQALLLTGAGTLWQSGALTIRSGGQLMVSNASGAAIGAVLTNSGAISVFNSSIGWLNDTVFNLGSRFLSQASSNTFYGNLTVDPGASFVQSADSWFSVLGNYVNQGSATYSNQVTVNPGQTYQSTGATNDFAGGLMIASGGGLNVGQGASVVGGVITNLGLINVLNGSVAFNNPVVNLGAYVSDPSTNTFNGTLTVGPTGYVSAAAGDVYAFGADFVMGSTNAAFNMASAVAYFGSTNCGITTGTTSHTFDLSGSGAMDIGTGYTNFSQVAANYAIGTLSVGVSNRLTITGMRSGGTTNALYIRLLDIPWADTNSFAGVTNTLMQALYLPDINVYYDYDSGENAWLNEFIPGTGYDLWGGGKLLPIPEPTSLTLWAIGIAAGLVLRRRERKPLSR